MVEFFVGLVVGASAVVLIMIVVGPTRRVRAEPPLPDEVETRLLLGQDPEQPTSEQPIIDHERQYSANELAALQRLGEEQQQRRRRRR